MRIGIFRGLFSGRGLDVLPSGPEFLERDLAQLAPVLELGCAVGPMDLPDPPFEAATCAPPGLADGERAAEADVETGTNLPHALSLQ